MVLAKMQAAYGRAESHLQPAQHSAEASRALSEPQQFPPLESVTRPTVDTAAAAYYLNRKPQTCRAWACLENGPLRPIRISGRLAWPVSELRRVLQVTQ